MIEFHLSMQAGEWFGLVERINVHVFLLWVVLAIILLWAQKGPGTKTTIGGYLG